MSSGFGKEEFYQYTTESSGIRRPQTQPKVLTAVGRGRGRGKPREEPSSQVQQETQASTYSQAPVGASPVGQFQPEPAHLKQNMAFQHALAAKNEGLRKYDTDPLATAVRQAQMPFREHRDATQAAEKRRAAQKYIPGLTPRPVDLEPPPGMVDKAATPKKVPPELIKAFLNGTKHPVSAIMEYSSMVRADTTFREACVERPSYIAKFACVCTVNGVSYPQGTGSTKKEAKTEAGKIAFTAILGIEDDDVDEGESDTMIYDSFGRCVQLDSKTPINGPLPPPITAQTLSKLPMEMLANPVSKLMEYCQKIHLPYTLTVKDGWDANNKPEYTAVVIVGEKPIASGMGKTKKDAKKLACSQALVVLQSGQVHFGMADDDILLHDSIASMSHKTHMKLLKKSPQAFWGGKILAAFVIKLSEQDGGHVVSVGSGCSSLYAGKLTPDGRSLIDGHAEVVARRGLLRYFHRKIKEYYEAPPSCQSASMFNQNPGSYKLSLKENITVHLYVSEAPFGDSTAFLDDPSPALDDKQLDLLDAGAHFPNFAEGEDFMGLLSLKSEHEQMASPLCMSDAPSPTVESLQAGQAITVMSTSDKILSWNVLGLQGALIGCFLEPVYLSTITIGKDFDHGHQARAFCCRVDDKINHVLPYGYRLNHPKMDTVTKYEDSWKLFDNTLSMNWMHGDADNQIEVVDMTTGRSVEASPFRTSASGASRCSKAGFLFRYRDLAKAAKNRQLYDAKTYADAKMTNQPYQQAKKILHQHLAEANFGTWVRKPKQLSLFTK